MFLLFSVEYREKTIGKGQFFCPGSLTYEPYRKNRAGNYLSFFLIPIFLLRPMGETVICETCGGRYETGILSYSEQQIREHYRPWACPICGVTNPGGQRICSECGN